MSVSTVVVSPLLLAMSEERGTSGKRERIRRRVFERASRRGAVLGVFFEAGED